MLRVILLLLVFLIATGCNFSEKYNPRDGDIIFHTSRSAQSIAIQRATKSKYSHMGIVYLKEGQPYVFEAIEPVKLTPLKEWAARGVGGHYIVKRLANADELITGEGLNRMLKVGKGFEGKHYDLYFEWSDDRVYCSELVWKIYKRALGIEVGTLQRMHEFDFSDPVVKAKVQKRFGDSIPQNEIVISPAAMFSAEELITVYQN